MTEAEAAGSADFAARMLHMLNEAALALMVSVGHRTGLFDAMAAVPAATSAEIAARAGLNERYVREWLAAMTTGRIVGHDGAAGSFSLPADHAAWLTRAAGQDNLAAPAQYVGLLALVEDQIVDRFRHGGGVPWDATWPSIEPARRHRRSQMKDRPELRRSVNRSLLLASCLLVRRPAPYRPGPGQRWNGWYGRRTCRCT